MLPDSAYRYLLITVVLILAGSRNYGRQIVFADDVVESLTNSLSKDLIPNDQALRDVRRFSAGRIRPVPEIATVAEWKNYSEQLRETVLNDIVFRGTAAEWRTIPGHVEMLDEIPGGPDYSIRKLRFEVLPGLWIPA